MKTLPWKAITVSATLALLTILIFTGTGQAYLAPNVLKGGHGNLDITCTECHVPFSGVPDLACQSCHKGIARAQLLKEGLHGGAVGNCEKCHSMHRGKKAGLIKDSLDHERLSFSLKKHEKTSCLECHQKDLRADTSGKCVSCHLEGSTGKAKEQASFAVHLWGLSRLAVPANKGNGQNINGLLARGAAPLLGAAYLGLDAPAAPLECSQCHVGGSKLRYDHGAVNTSYKRAEFFVTGHKEASCKDCHGLNNYQVRAETCSECHRDSRAHGPISGKCSECHVSKAWKPAKSGHDPRLAGAHVKLDCRECHTVKKKLASTIESCASCHKVKHRAFASGRGCLSCHNQSKWSQTSFKHTAGSACRTCHRPPAGHYGSSCQSCHGTGKSWKSASSNKHPGASSACTNCHNRPRAHSRGSCSQCHRVGTTWSRGVQGGHPGASSACTNCHRRPRGHYSSSCTQCHRVGTTWRTSGKSRSHPGLSATCSNCHSKRGHYSGSCQKCHTSTKSWRSARFSHPKVREHSWRSFSCSSCHPSGYGSTNCTTCHARNGEGGDDDDEEEDDDD